MKFSGIWGNAIQVLHKIYPRDKIKPFEFATDILDRLDHDREFLDRFVFSDEATFHVSGRVHRHNVRMWGNEPPYVSMEHQRDSPKVNLWCAIGRDRIIGPFFFAEQTVTGKNFLDMLEGYPLNIDYILNKLIFIMKKCWGVGVS
jgi:hypothetical protein